MGWLLKMPGTAIHRLSRHFEMSTFYLGENEPVFVGVLFAGKPKRVAGVDIEGTRAHGTPRPMGSTPFTNIQGPIGLPRRIGDVE